MEYRPTVTTRIAADGSEVVWESSKLSLLRQSLWPRGNSDPLVRFSISLAKTTEVTTELEKEILSHRIPLVWIVVESLAVAAATTILVYWILTLLVKEILRAPFAAFLSNQLDLYTHPSNRNQVDCGIEQERATPKPGLTTEDCQQLISEITARKEVNARSFCCRRSYRQKVERKLTEELDVARMLRRQKITESGLHMTDVQKVMAVHQQRNMVSSSGSAIGELSLINCLADNRSSDVDMRLFWGCYGLQPPTVPSLEPTPE